MPTRSERSDSSCSIILSTRNPFPRKQHTLSVSTTTGAGGGSAGAAAAAALPPPSRAPSPCCARSPQSAQSPRPEPPRAPAADPRPPRHERFGGAPPSPAPTARRGRCPEPPPAAAGDEPSPPSQSASSHWHAPLPSPLSSTSCSAAIASSVARARIARRIPRARANCCTTRPWHCAIRTRPSPRPPERGRRCTPRAPQRATVASRAATAHTAPSFSRPCPTPITELAVASPATATDPKHACGKRHRRPVGTGSPTDAHDATIEEPKDRARTRTPCRAPPRRASPAPGARERASEREARAFTAGATCRATAAVAIATVDGAARGAAAAAVRSAVAERARATTGAHATHDEQLIASNRGTPLHPCSSPAAWHPAWPSSKTTCASLPANAAWTQTVSAFWLISTM